MNCFPPQFVPQQEITSNLRKIVLSFGLKTYFFIYSLQPLLWLKLDCLPKCLSVCYGYFWGHLGNLHFIVIVICCKSLNMKNFVYTQITLNILNWNYLAILDKIRFWFASFIHFAYLLQRFINLSFTSRSFFWKL